MNWTDQMQQMMRAWAEAQQKMASEWTTAMHKAAAPGTAAAEDWGAKWREQAATNFDTYVGKVGGVPGSVAQRMFEGAQTYHQFVELVATALRNLAPKLGAGGDWGAGLNQYLQEMQGKLKDQPHLWMKPEALAAMSGDVSELWKLFLAQASSFSAPWAESLGQARGHWGEVMGGDHRAAIRMTNLFTDTFESTLGKFTGAPTIGYSREYQEKLGKTFDAWVDMKKAEVAFHTELTAIGFRALQALVGRLKEMASTGEKIESSRKLFDLWVEIAEKTYFEAASTEAFAQTQADLVNASMHHKVHERTLLEIFYKSVHLPTRQEIDDAYKHLHGLRSQVKQLAKQASALQAEIASLNEFRGDAQAATQKTAKTLAALQTEVASLKEFRKEALAASRQAAKAAAKAPVKKKAPATKQTAAAPGKEDVTARAAAASAAAPKATPNTKPAVRAETKEG